MKRAEHAGPSWRKKKLFNLENETLLLTYDSSSPWRALARLQCLFIIFSLGECLCDGGGCYYYYYYIAFAIYFDTISPLGEEVKRLLLLRQRDNPFFYFLMENSHIC